MIFDKLCGIAERHELIGGFVIPFVRSARIFKFDEKPHEFLPKDLNQALIDEVFLPFDIIAVEDNASCVILADSEEQQMGCKAYRTFVECIPMDLPESEFDRNAFSPDAWEAVQASQEIKPYMKGYYQVTIGQVILKCDDADPTHKFSIGGAMVMSWVVSKEKIDRQWQPNPRVMDEASPLRNAGVALQEIMYLNRPKNFILEEKPLKSKHNGKGDKIRRSIERPIFTILHPNEIRRKLHLPEPTGDKHASPMPHERKRHPRVLTSDKFKNKQGQTIIIPATWIGPSEATVGNKRYKVRLDL